MASCSTRTRDIRFGSLMTSFLSGLFFTFLLIARKPGSMRFAIVVSRRL